MHKRGFIVKREEFCGACDVPGSLTIRLQSARMYDIIEDMETIYARGDGRDVILQAFHWNLVKTQGTGTVDGRSRSWYAVLLDTLDRIVAAGFSVLYLPPPWRDDSAWSAEGKHGGGEGYFWHDFDLDSRYGTRAELVTLVGEAHRRGLKVIADIVLNHRDGGRMAQDVWAYPGPCWRNGGRDSGGSFMDGHFDLALEEKQVQERIGQALQELQAEVGIDGWRWDYVWGYEPRDVQVWLGATKGREYISIGEYWQSSNERTDDPLIARYGHDEGRRILGWARETGSLAYDIILKRQIQTANPANLKYGLNMSADAADRASVMTFVDNHDMGASPWSAANGWGQQCWPCPPDFKSRAYAFILTAPGVPCVYWPDCYDWGFEWMVGELIALRRKAGIVAGSAWTDLTGNHEGIAYSVADAAGRDALVVAIGSGYPGPGAGWKIALSQPGEWVVWVPS